MKLILDEAILEEEGHKVVQVGVEVPVEVVPTLQP